MLIKCPECNKEISDQSEKCVNCGYPIKDYLAEKEIQKLKNDPNICFIANKPHNLSKYLQLINTNTIISEVQSSIIDDAYNEGWLDDIRGKVSDDIIDYMAEHHEIPKTWKSYDEQHPYKIEPQIPKCPTCGSTNIKNISGTKRWLSTGIFGLASSNIGKTMQCNSCGYKW